MLPFLSFYFFESMAEQEQPVTGDNVAISSFCEIRHFEEAIQGKVLARDVHSQSLRIEINDETTKEFVQASFLRPVPATEFFFIGCIVVFFNNGTLKTGEVIAAMQDSAYFRVKEVGSERVFALEPSLFFFGGSQHHVAKSNLVGCGHATSKGTVDNAYSGSVKLKMKKGLQKIQVDSRASLAVLKTIETNDRVFFVGIPTKDPKVLIAKLLYNESKDNAILVDIPFGILTEDPDYLDAGVSLIVESQCWNHADQYFSVTNKVEVRDRQFAGIVKKFTKGSPVLVIKDGQNPSNVSGFPKKMPRFGKVRKKVKKR
eukprot:Lithocolla_globosa_v1_NODE_248_length_4862_cov_4.242147.p2 type:complete len:315 gc:universal NODE_248_length_4862_cov_4.242147:3830-4774(+)